MKKRLQEKHVWTLVSRKFAPLTISYTELFTVVNDPFTSEYDQYFRR